MCVCVCVCVCVDVFRVHIPHSDGVRGSGVMVGYLFMPLLHPLMPPIAMPPMFVELTEQQADRFIFFFHY